MTDACAQELNAGIGLQKKTIIMSDPLLALQLQPHFGSNLVVLDPANPDQAETGIVRYLKTVDAEKNVKNALLALGTLALGLLIFAPTDRK